MNSEFRIQNEAHLAAAAGRRAGRTLPALGFILNSESDFLAVFAPRFILNSELNTGSPEDPTLPDLGFVLNSESDFVAVFAPRFILNSELNTGSPEDPTLPDLASF